MDADLSLLLDDLSHVDDTQVAEQSVQQRHAPWLLTAPEEVVDELLERLPRSDVEHPARRVFVGGVAFCLAQRCRGRQATGQPGGMRAERAARIAELYRGWGREVPGRAALLAWLATSRQDDALRVLAELLAEDPPRDASVLAQILSPLLQDRDYDPAIFFPRLLHSLQYPDIAAPILDLCNYWTRSGQVDQHPAADRSGQLIQLLAQLSGRLGQLDHAPSGEAGQAARHQRQVFEGLSLVVSLCDALALIGDRAAVPALRDALRLRHRRVRAEAAAALAYFGEEAGRQALVELAAEPVTRLRVLAYVEELGLSDRIDEAYQTPAARAESELALWLSQPPQFGLPPQRIDLFDSRTLYWPGYDEPRECFLLRFSYQLAEGEYHNVGIAGPLTHAFRADLSDLPPDDIYAAFAGWDAEHEEISHHDAAQLTEGQRVEVARLDRRLRDAGYDDIRPRLLGYFLGDWVLVASARREGQEGTVVADADSVQWRQRQAVTRPLDAETEYCIYKGRRMLRAFND